MDELQRVKMQNQSLRQELSSLRSIHQLTLLELTEAHDNYEKYKKLNDALIKNIENNQIDLDKLKNINLVIDGSFGCSNCAVLETELDKYRTGVNESVERRVKEIARNLTQLDEENSKKSRMSSGNKNNFFINFNKKNKQCQNCKQLSNLLDKSNQTIHMTNSHIKQLQQERDILNRKLYNVQSLVNNLKKQNQILQSEINKLSHHFQDNSYNQNQQQENLPSWNYPQYSNQSKFHSSNYKKKNRNLIGGQIKKQEKMMRQITNLISCLSTKESDQGRGKSRTSNLRDSSALFSIKNGINRPQKHYY